MSKYNFYIAELKGRLEETKEKAIEARIRKRYSISNEFAILRQRDTKPEEFAEYDAFVEQIKADVNAEYEAQKEKFSKIISGIAEDGKIIYADKMQSTIDVSNVHPEEANPADEYNGLKGVI